MLADIDRQRSLRKTTKLFASMIHGVDLAPTDIVTGLILVAALQRRRRRIHIWTMLRPWEVPPGLGPREKLAVAGTMAREQVRRVAQSLPVFKSCFFPKKCSAVGPFCPGGSNLLIPQTAPSAPI
jgi:hypothetical protein